jgi:hypothetical protein
MFVRDKPTAVLLSKAEGEAKAVVRILLEFLGGSAAK